MAGTEKTVKKLLKQQGYSMDRRPRGSHDIWSKDGHEISVPSKIKKRHTANAILKESGIPDKL